MVLPLLRFILFSVISICFARIAAAAPNIILILTDDHGWSQLSAQMDPALPASKSNYLETPHMNRMANAGLRFTSGYSPAPLCTPTRRSILNGTSAARSGTEFASPNWIPAEHLTIPRALKAANPNYRTAHFGKWGEQMISTPEECGYDASDGMTGNETGGMPKSLGIVSGKHGDGPNHYIDNTDPKRTLSVTESAIDFMAMQVQDDKPFYVQVSYYAQHLSVVTRDSLLEKYGAKGPPDRGYPPAWAAMMEELDNGVGQLLDAVERLGIGDNTYIFFTADNGGRGTVPGGDNKATAPNHPLSGAKHSLLEGGIRVPFIVVGPGIKPGSQSRIPVVGYDFLPTFHDLANGQPNQLTSEVDGVSIAPLLGEETADEFLRPQEAVFFHRPRRSMSAIRQDDHKLMLYWNKEGGIEKMDLFEVDSIPTEKGHNLAVQKPKLAATLRDKLLAQLERVGAASN